MKNKQIKTSLNANSQAFHNTSFPQFPPKQKLKCFSANLRFTALFTSSRIRQMYKLMLTCLLTNCLKRNNLPLVLKPKSMYFQASIAKHDFLEILCCATLLSSQPYAIFCLLQDRVALLTVKKSSYKIHFFNAALLKGHFSTHCF